MTPTGRRREMAGAGSGCAVQAGEHIDSVPETICTPTGSRSLRSTLVTASAVGLARVTVYRMKSPRRTTGVSDVIDTRRTSPRKTGAVIVGSSSAGSAGSFPVSSESERPGSSEIALNGPAAVSAAWLLIAVPPGAAPSTVTWYIRVAEVIDGTLPTFHTRFGRPVSSAPGPLIDPGTYVVFAGTGSVTTTAVAPPKPLFVTVIV